MLLKGGLTTLQQRLFQLLVFLLPTQLGYHFWPNWAYIFGLRIDYLSPTIYLTDILVFFLVFLWIVKKKKNVLTLVKNKYFQILAVFAVLNIIFALIPQAALLKWMKIFELSLLAYLLWSENNLDLFENLVKPLALGTIFVFLLALAQFVLQGSLGGVFYFFGERTFNSGTPGIALYSIFEKLYLRPYSTFSHPNSMAGFAGVALLLFTGVLFESKKKSLILTLGIVSCLGTIILSGSKTVFIALILITGLYVLIKARRAAFSKVLLGVYLAGVIGSMLLPVVSDILLRRQIQFSERLGQRLVLADIGGRAFSQKALLGLGLNNFIPSVVELRKTDNLPWVLQPVHNVPLLVLAEGGIVGFGIFIWFIYELLKRVSGRSIFFGLIILFVILTSLSDHYWFTLQQNQLLVVVLSVVLLRQKRKEFLLN